MSPLSASFLMVLRSSEGDDLLSQHSPELIESLSFVLIIVNNLNRFQCCGNVNLLYNGLIS